MPQQQKGANQAVAVGAEVGTPVALARPGESRRSLALREASRFAIVGVAIVLVAVAQLNNATFLEWDRIMDLLSQNAAIGIVAVGLTIVVIGGGIDFSVGATFAAGAVVSAKLCGDTGLIVAVIAALLVGGIAGLINALLVTRLKINPFVATLGTGFAFAGAVLAYSGPDAILPEDDGFATLASNELFGIPNAVWLLAIAIALGAALLSRTIFGKSVYAIGNSLEASRLTGIGVDRYRAATYVLSGMAAAGAGIVYTSQAGVAQGNFGADTPLNALAIVVIGGTSLAGGEGAMWRTVIGIAIFATINSIFTVNAVQVSDQQLILGGIVLLALLIDAVTSRRRAA